MISSTQLLVEVREASQKWAFNSINDFMFCPLDRINAIYRQKHLEKSEWKWTIDAFLALSKSLVSMEVKNKKNVELLKSFMFLYKNISNNMKTLQERFDKPRFKKDVDLFGLYFFVPIILMTRSAKNLEDINKCYKKMDAINIRPFPDFQMQKLIDWHSHLFIICTEFKCLAILFMSAHFFVSGNALQGNNCSLDNISRLSYSLNVLNPHEEEYQLVKQNIEQVHNILKVHPLCEKLGLVKFLDVFSEPLDSPDLLYFILETKDFLDETEHHLIANWFSLLANYMGIYDWVTEKLQNYNQLIFELRDHLKGQLAGLSTPLSPDDIEELQLVISTITNVLGFYRLNLQLILPYLLEILQRKKDFSEKDTPFFQTMKNKINVGRMLKAVIIQKHKDEVNRAALEEVDETTDSPNHPHVRTESRPDVVAQAAPALVKNVEKKERRSVFNPLQSSDKLRTILKRLRSIGFKPLRSNKHLILGKGPHRAVVPHGGGGHLTPGVIQNLNFVMKNSVSSEFDEVD